MNYRDEFYSVLIPDFNDKMSERRLTTANIAYLENCIAEFEEMIEAGKKARIIFQEIAQKTQKNLEDHISNLVTLALKAVSPDFPNFVVEFVVRRNQLECDLWFETNGFYTAPMFSSGGGPKDIASFALFISHWSLDKNRATIILDEPFRNVSPDLQGNVGDMLRMINDELELQLIMVSHADTINESADKEFTIDLIEGISHVKEN